MMRACVGGVQPALHLILLVLLSVANVQAQIRGTVTKHPYPRLESALAQMVVAVDTGEQRSRALAGLENPLVDRTRVPVTVRVSDVPSVSAWLRAVGANVVNSSEDVIEAYVSADNLRDLDSLQGVASVKQITPAAERAISQGAIVHNAKNWHDNGRLGSGVRVGIVDVGFVGFSTLMGTELPASVTARCYSSIGIFSSSLGACQSVTSHGTAVAESLIDIAPAVQLFIANPKSRLDFRQTIDWMTSQGIRVINYSAAQLWDGPGDGTSPYSDSPLRAVDAAIAGGATLVMAAGNEGRSTYFGSFSDIDGNDWAEFPAGTEDNKVFLNAGERLSIQLRWQDSWGFSARDLDLLLFNPSYQLVASSVDVQAGAASAVPFEALSYTAPTTGVYYIGVNRYAGTMPAWIQVQNFSSQALAYFTLGSIGSPAETANSGALAVGAAPWYSPGSLESFSSRGPTPDGRLKPDVVGVDRGDTTAYGVGAFAGTSQASSHVAGLAALVVEALPGYSAAQVAGYLKAVAAPGSGTRPNIEWGYGLPVMQSVCGYSFSPTSLTVPRSGGTVSLAVNTAFGCTWIAQSGASFVSVVTGTSGVGIGTVTLQVQPNSGIRRTGQITVAGYSVPVTQLGPPGAQGDFDGDRAAELSLFRPANGTWMLRYSSSDFAAGVELTFGLSTDKPVPGDYDGDGRLDIAVWRPSNGIWYVIYSSTGALVQLQWGISTDIPMQADYTGDGRTDLAVWRPENGVWFIFDLSTGTYTSRQWGISTDIPLTGDYDGDDKADVVAFRPSNGYWYVFYSSTQTYSVLQWGISTDIPLPADYDGDGREDLAVYRPSNGYWFVFDLKTGTYGTYQWGLSTDVPVPKDYDGDGRTDLAVWRESTGQWLVYYLGTNTWRAISHGMAGDVPIR